jgi:hypothetical protein
VFVSKGLIASLAGLGAGLVLAGAYFGAPYAGVSISPTMVMVAVAVFVFASTVTLLTHTALTAPDRKGPRPWRRIGDLGPKEYRQFPGRALKPVLKPDTFIDEWDLVRHTKRYENDEVFLTIKKAKGKLIHNPLVIQRLFRQIASFPGFEHILLVNEHDEYVGYLPAAYARLKMTGTDAESLITRYIVDVLANPKQKSIDLREIGGLSIDETISDNETVSAALQKLSEGLFRGFVVFKDKRNRKPVGVIYEEHLYRAAIKLD